MKKMTRKMFENISSLVIKKIHDRARKPAKMSQARLGVQRNNEIGIPIESFCNKMNTYHPQATTNGPLAITGTSKMRSSGVLVSCAAVDFDARGPEMLLGMHFLPYHY
jgi:hypothetical protein